MNYEDMEIAMKIVIVGNGVVGKSSMMQRFCKGTFTNQYKKTLGVDFMERMFRIKSEKIRLMLWDTAGQEEFDAITKAYYRGANACVIVFSGTDRESFLSIEKWKNKVEFECGEIPTAVVQNKIDLYNECVVERHEIENSMKKFKWNLFKTSVKDNINVENVFHFLAESYIDSLCDEYNEEPVVSTHLSLFPNSISSNKSSNVDKPFATNPLFNQIVGQYSIKYELPSKKKEFCYINNGFGLHSVANNPVFNHYGYKNKFRGRPVRPNNSGILLHRHQNHNLISKHSLKDNYFFSNSYASDNCNKNSFFKTCSIL